MPRSVALAVTGNIENQGAIKGGTMSTKVERSPSGRPIYHHEERQDRDDRPAQSDTQALASVEDHLQQHIGSGMVFHELISGYVHLDVHLIFPTPAHNYHTLVTSGMSDLPMHVPEDYQYLQYAELMLCLPPDWPLEQAAFKDERNYWPIRLLKILGRLPHQFDTWLGIGHTMPNGDPPAPFAGNTALCGAILATPRLFGEGFAELAVRADKTINFYSVIPLYAEEMSFKLNYGSEALFQRLAPVTELLDTQRMNVCR